MLILANLLRLLVGLENAQTLSEIIKLLIVFAKL
jgi:cystathionine beta-lyase/cystathionine gamma-synthase